MNKKKSKYNFQSQEEVVEHKIVDALERISTSIKSLMWDYGKASGMSPIQIQILSFVNSHTTHLTGVSQLAKEFNVAKPTVSDAVKTLESKGYVIRKPFDSDKRSHGLCLTDPGRNVLIQVSQYTKVLKDSVSRLTSLEQLHLYKSLTKLIYDLNVSGVITIQRTCFGCKYYKLNDVSHFCNLLNTQLTDSEIRIDCPDFTAKAS